MRDDNNNDLAVIETVVVMDEKDRATRIRVSGNRDAVDNDVRWFSQRLYIALALFGIASILLNGLIILWALRPLDRARVALAAELRGEHVPITFETAVAQTTIDTIYLNQEAAAFLQD